VVPVNEISSICPSHYSGGAVIKATIYFFCKGLFKSCSRGVVVEPNAHILFIKWKFGTIRVSDLMRVGSGKNGC
jgi:hypothetical protein